MNDKRINLLAKAPVSKAVNKLAMPAIIGLLVNAIYNVVDTMFVAWIGTEATGATQVVLPIVLVATALGLGFGIGGGSYLSRLLGEKQIEKAQEVTSTLLFSGIIAGIIFVVINLLFLEDVLLFFGATSEVMDMAKDYGFFIVISGLFLIVNMVLNNLLRSEGSGSYSMVGLATGAILNIILDPIFIFVFDMGISGAAIATMLSYCVSTGLLLSFYLRKRTVVKMKLSSIKPTINLYKEVLVIGGPTFVKQILFSCSIVLLNQKATEFGGDELLAAIGIAFRFTMLTTNIIFGIGQGLQPVAGYNFGAQNKERIIKSLKYTMKLTAYVVFISFLITFIFTPQIMDVFKAAPEVKKYGIIGLRYMATGIIFFGFANTITIFFLAIGRGLESLILSIARQGLIFIPLLYILTYTFGYKGVLVSQAVADILTLLLSVFLFARFMKLNKLDKEMNLEN
ncbi:MATE family efflux transporter [Mycoplasmatota bacterium]|nr:MATE family efflux transporter [Mycoplasmatota bacterium]